MKQEKMAQKDFANILRGLIDEALIGESFINIYAVKGLLPRLNIMISVFGHKQDAIEAAALCELDDEDILARNYEIDSSS